MQLLCPLLPCLLAASCLCMAQEGPQAAPAAPVPGSHTATPQEGNGISPLPTAGEIAQLPPATFNAHNRAIKHVLLTQILRAKEENRRITPDNLAACAQLARQLEAPASFSQLLLLEANDQLTARERHDIQSKLTELYKAYRIDETSLRYYVEGSHLPADALKDAFTWLPIESLFNRLPLQKPSFTQMESDYIELGRIAGERSRIYSQIRNTEQADAAAFALVPLLARHEATLATRLMAEETDQKNLKSRYGLITKTIMQQLKPERERLQRENYYDSIRLRAIDYLFD